MQGIINDPLHPLFSDPWFPRRTCQPTRAGPPSRPSFKLEYPGRCPYSALVQAMPTQLIPLPARPSGGERLGEGVACDESLTHVVISHLASLPSGRKISIPRHALQGERRRAILPLDRVPMSPVGIAGPGRRASRRQAGAGSHAERGHAERGNQTIFVLVNQKSTICNPLRPFLTDRYSVLYWQQANPGVYHLIFS